MSTNQAALGGNSSRLSRLVASLKDFYVFAFGGNQAQRAGRAWKRSLWLVLLLGGTVPLILYGNAQPSPPSVIAGGVLVALASAVVGAVLGLLFGMPRAMPHSDTAGHDVAPSTPVRANTNLEDVSDWLTKILVGVGLTQLASISGEFGRLVDAAAGAIAGNPQPGTVVGALILTYSGTGFLLTYLFARTDLVADVCEADAASVVFQEEVAKARELKKLHDEGIIGDDVFQDRIGKLKLA